MSKKEGKDGEVSGLHSKILNLAGGRRNKPDPTPADEPDLDIPLPGAGGEETEGLAPIYPGAEGSGEDLAYGDMEDPAETRANGKRPPLSPAQRLGIVITVAILVGVALFKGTGELFAPSTSIPELTPSPIAAPDANAVPLVDVPAPNYDEPDGMPSFAGEDQASVATDTPAVPSATGAEDPAVAAAPPVSMPDVAPPSAPAPAAPATPEVNPFAALAPAAPEQPLSLPSPAKPSVPAVPAPAPAPQPAIQAPVMLAPQVATSVAAPTEEETEQRIKRLERQMSAANSKLREHDKKFSAPGMGVDADGRPRLLVKWIASAARNCSECRAKALVTTGGRDVYVAAGDSLAGYAVDIQGDRLILTGKSGAFSYYAGPGKI